MDKQSKDKTASIEIPVSMDKQSKDKTASIEIPVSNGQTIQR